LTPYGVSLDLDPSTYPDDAMAFGIYELDTMRLLRRLLRAGDVFADAGANLGYFTTHAAKLVGPKGRVHAFEPDPDNRARLTGHVALNALGNVTVHATALGAEAGSITLYKAATEGSNHGMSSVHAELAGSSAGTEVPLSRMDALVTETPKVVKIDVEGSELAVLAGMTGFLTSANPPALIIEHNPESARATGHSAADLPNAILAANARYRLFWIGARLVPVTPGELGAQARQGNILARV
jgi:FkbM family methyltransferase